MNRQSLNPYKNSLTGIRGQLLTFHHDPFLFSSSESYTYYEDALVVINDGLIIDVGNFEEVSRHYPQLNKIDCFENSLIMPGFIDAHIHYVQTPMIGSHGDTLLKWLNNYTFPTECKFSDINIAEQTARIFFHQLLSNGTTTANVFCTTFKESVDAFFEESIKYGTRMIAGKVLQDRYVPDALKDKNAESSVILAEDLLYKWHNKDRQLYAVIPRFAPTSTPQQLKLAGELYKNHINEGVYLHTHLDEVQSEIDWVKELFPGIPTYTEVYHQFGLIADRSVLAHCCIVEPREWEILYHNECGVVHCPSSNLFLGDGEFKFREAKNPQHPVKLGIATDVGGGTNFSLIRQIGEAYKVGMLQDNGLTAMQGFYMATKGSAEALHLQDKIGSIQPGFEADITVIDLAPNEFIEWRMQFANNIFEKLFVLSTLGPDNVIKATYISGNKVYDRDADVKFCYKI
ncbi:MAG: guanine deaminase [Prevotella sp.]|nr:guanine deaminase [Bacteroides sp.]MCM1365654.1 guanine deaminase [Prevotella sp.]